MNKDQVTGKVEQVTGKIKQGVGETVGNEDLANRGVVDQTKGAAKEAWGNAKTRRRTYVNRAKMLRSNTRTTRVTKSAIPSNKMKDRVNEKIEDIKDRRRA